MYRFLIAASAVAVMAVSSAWAQGTTATEPLPWQTQPQAPTATAPPPSAAPTPPAPTTMYATKDANIRAGAGKGYAVIGKAKVNTALQVVGLAPGGWYQLATGGFISAHVVSPAPVTIAQRPPVTVPAPSAAYYPVGACEPYSRVVNIGGQPNQINGTACKQPDGSWRIVNYSVPTQVVAPAPVYVAPAPLVYAPPPPPVIVEHVHRDPYYYGRY